MRAQAKSPPSSLLLAGFIAMVSLALGAAKVSAQDADASRGVTILDAPTPGPDGVTPARPSTPDQTNVAPTLEAPSPPPPNLGKPFIERLKIANAAALSIEILPGQELAVGTRVSFRISSRKPGYLVLVDVDASGKVTQIYPNRMSLMNAPGGRQSSNLVRPGRPLLVPNPQDAYAGFEFVTSPPQGTAMIVALLSDRPVQVIDLPDVPPDLIGQEGALSFLSKAANELRIASEEPGRLQEPRWSFDAKFYAVR